MECRVCGHEISSEARFCSSCGSQVTSPEEEEEILAGALDEAEKVFQEELERVEPPTSTGDEAAPTQGYEDSGEPELVGEETGDTSRKSAIERLHDMHRAVRKSTDSAVQFGKRVGDGTSRAIKKTKEVSSDVSQKVGSAVEKTKGFGQDVADAGKKAGAGVGKAVKRTKETMDELGQVGVIITQRALDVVRASLRAVEIVDEYLAKRNSAYEVGSFTTGVGIPPYLEILFQKRADDSTHEERCLIQAVRERGISCTELADMLDSLPQSGSDSSGPAHNVDL